MGYYSDFTLEVINKPVNLTFSKILNSVESMGIKFDLNQRLCQVKWYDHEEDLRKLSLTFPTCYFVLTAIGEDFTQWGVYAHDGEVERVDTAIFYPVPANTNLIPPGE